MNELTETEQAIPVDWEMDEEPITWKAVAIIRTMPDYGGSPFYTNVEPWDPQKTPIKLLR